MVAQKAGPPCPKGGPEIGGTMPKSYPRRNAVWGKNRRFRKVFAPKVAISTKILEMAKGRTRQRQFRTLCVQKLRGGLARNNGPDPVDGDPRNIGGLNERFEDVRGNRAQDFVIITAGHDLSHGARSCRKRSGSGLRQWNGRKLYCCRHGRGCAELGEIATQPIRAAHARRASRPYGRSPCVAGLWHAIAADQHVAQGGI